MATRKDELAKLYRDYNEISKIIIDLTGIILNDKLIDNKYKDLLCCFDNVSLPEIHHSISKLLLGCMTLSNHNIIDFEDISDTYLYSGALLKYDLHKDNYIDKYIEAQTNTILSLSDNAKILNTAKKYKELDDNEYNKLIGCIYELFKYAVVTAKVLNCIYDNNKEE